VNIEEKLIEFDENAHRQLCLGLKNQQSSFNLLKLKRREKNRFHDEIRNIFQDRSSWLISYLYRGDEMR